MLLAGSSSERQTWSTVDRTV